MLELICGTRNEGKTRLALNRVIYDYKYNNKQVVYFTDTGELEDFHNILVWHDIDVFSVTCKKYYPITMILCKKIDDIFETICDMRASCCTPDVVCIDWHLKAKELKEVERIERIFRDTLFIVTVNTDTMYDAIHKIDIEE